MELYQDKDSTGAPTTAAELSDRIEAEIAAGRLDGGERLPPIRDMAALLSLAPNTVAAAYRRLADRGVVVTRGRAGTFVLERPPLGAHRSPVVPPGAIDLASGGPDPRLLPELDRFLVHPGPSSSYNDPALLPQLEEAGTAWLARQGFHPDRLVVTSGGLDAIERVLVAHLRPGDAVAVERPGWSAVTDLISALGMRSVGVTVDDRGMSPESLASRLPGVAAVIVTPRAHNPTGAAVDGARRTELAAVLDERPEVLVVEDDHAGPISGVELASLGGGRPRWAFIQSVAKALGPDLRLALVAGDDLTLDRVSGRFGLGPGWVSRILQGAVAAMMVDPEVGTLLERAAEEYSARRKALVGALRGHGLEGAAGRSGVNVWTPVGSEEAVTTAVAEAGFVVRGGSGFRASEPAVRITVSQLETGDIPRLVPLIAGRGLPGGRAV